MVKIMDSVLTLFDKLFSEVVSTPVHFGMSLENWIALSSEAKELERYDEIYGELPNGLLRRRYRGIPVFVFGTTEAIAQKLGEPSGLPEGFYDLLYCFGEDGEFTFDPVPA